MSLTKVSYSMINGAPANVLDFGADPTGLTDCTAAIQNAVNALDAEGGGTLYFPTGTYLLVGKNTPISNASRLVDGVFLKSNITIQGDGYSSIIQVSTNCANAFVFGNYTANVTPLTNTENVIIRDIQIARATATFYEFNFQINLQSGSNVLIENVYFNGWSGDAICIGAVNTPDLQTYFSSISDNIRITNCKFDGINKDTRQAVSILSGTNISIDNNIIVNTTRSDMPGAIDLEPELAFHLIENIKIYSNIFDNIGGGAGVIGCNLFANLTNLAKNIFVYNNLITNCNNNFVINIYGISTNTALIASNAPYNIVFENNNVNNNTGILFSVGGVSLCKISGNSFEGGSVPCQIGFTGNAQFLSLVNLEITNNIFTDCHVISPDFYTPLIAIYGKVGGGTFSGNTFISSGRWSDVNTPVSIEVVGFINATSLTSSYLTFVNNTVTTNGLPYSTAIPPFFASSTLTSPNTFAMVNNKFIGYIEYGDPFSLYTQVGNTAVTNGSASFQNLDADPSNPKKGDVYFNSTANILYCWNGTSWNALF
jgi:hypothetical protein